MRVHRKKHKIREYHNNNNGYRNVCCIFIRMIVHYGFDIHTDIVISGGWIHYSKHSACYGHRVIMIRS